MLIRLTEAYEIPGEASFGFREISINPEQIVAVRPDIRAKQALAENRMPTGLLPNTEFSRVWLGSGNSGLNVLVVGSPEQIEGKLIQPKKVLKG